MYRIMLVSSKRDNYESLYKFMTNTTATANGSTTTAPLELADKASLDTQVEKMLNEDGYAKSDFIVVKVVDYTVDAKDYSDDEEETANDQQNG